MELELGLKITRTRDDISSTTDLRIATDGGGIVFLSRETGSTFILTAHLKGYRKEHIDIKINEDGTRITIIGNKPVQETVLQGWILCKKEVEFRGFKKAFIIPPGVVLDKIKAKFDEEDGAILTVFMPKMVLGVSGHVIEEVEELEDDRGRVRKTGRKEIEEEHKDDATTKTKQAEQDTEEGVNGRELKASVAAHDAPTAEIKEPIKEATKEAPTREGEEGVTEPEEMPNAAPEPESSSPNQQRPKDDNHKDVREHTLGKSKPKKRKKICAPAVAGSTLLVSLIVIVIHWIRAKR